MSIPSMKMDEIESSFRLENSAPDREYERVGRLAVLGGILILFGIVSGAFGFVAVSAAFGIQNPLAQGGVGFVLCSATALGLLGCFGIRTGLLTRRRRLESGTGLVVVGLIAMVSAFFFVWWLPATLGGILTFVAGLRAHSKPARLPAP